MKIYLIIAGLLLGIFSAKAQNGRSFRYDASGNCISRGPILLGLRAASVENTDSTQITYDEVLSDHKILIYPNPTKGYLAVEIVGIDGDKTKGEIRILDMTGKLIESKKVTPEKMHFDLSNQLAGTYILCIELNEQVSTWKIIKQD